MPRRTDEPAVVEVDDDRHEYRVSGVLFPSVTQVLGLIGEDWSAMPASVLGNVEAAGEFGRHVHEAVHLLNIGNLDHADLDPALRPYLQQYERFLVETGYVIVDSEFIVVDRLLRYAGKPDSKGVLPARRKSALDRRAVLDVKTTAAVPRTVGPQTAAYAHPLGPLYMHGRYCLHLRPDDYRLIPQSDPTDWNVFGAALTCYHWKHRS
jgi:hypothetical protein